MIIYHAARRRRTAYAIVKEMLLGFGRNVAGGEYAHVSLTPFQPGNLALNVIAHDTNQAYIFKLKVADDIQLEDDPSDESDYYGGGWKVSTEPIPIQKIISITEVPNVINWERGIGSERNLRRPWFKGK